MATNYCIFLSDLKGNPTYLMESLHKHLPKDWKFHLVFRFKLNYLSEDKYSHIKPFYLYDNFKQLSEKDVQDEEKFLGKTFALIRLMSKVGQYRYPNIKKLPDDYYFANLVRSWRKFYLSNKINLFLAGVSDDYPSLIGFEVARKLGIKIIILNSSRFTNAYLLTDEDYQPIFYKKITEKEKKLSYHQAEKIIMGEKINNPELSKIVKKNFNFINPLNLLSVAKSFFPNFKIYYLEVPKYDRLSWYSTFEFVVKYIKSFIRSAISKQIFKYKPKKGEKYIFYPLHFTDDATITAKTPFIDQFQLIKEISKIIPHGVLLYVKPHPHFQCSDIPISKMRELSKLPNIRLLSYNEDTKQLVKNALYVAVINSSTAFEAMIIGTPAVTFGKDYPNEIVKHIKSPEELLNIKPTLDKKKAYDYVSKCYANSIFLRVPYYLKFDFTGNSDIKDLAKGIVQSYNMLCKGG
ncbi:MAG: hypothetical protein HY831_01625 [Candidatus Aenigmarchaeota archaeon]|nr:hypothetical protein [Candidatus Aenigmarchaeota archaeon]